MIVRVPFLINETDIMTIRNSRTKTPQQSVIQIDVILSQIAIAKFLGEYLPQYPRDYAQPLGCTCSVLS